MNRRKTRKIQVGKMHIGGNATISIQSMLNTKTSDIQASLRQINDLEEAGCEIIRVAVPDKDAVESLAHIRKNTNLPLVADIHFDPQMAVLSMPHVDKIRINPGNIAKDSLNRIINAAKDHDVAIRVGINAGSLEKQVKEKYGISPLALVESALSTIELFEKQNFERIVLSLKTSDVLNTIESYKLISEKCDYPLHIGITEAGAGISGTVKSAIGIGTLLAEGIGDTIRVSLTDNPINEVKTGFEILKSLGLRDGCSVISCPTCARAEFDVIKLAGRIQKITENVRKPLKIAVMGCAVNGPGEASESDIGVAGMKGQGLIFSRGKPIKTVDEKDILDELMKKIDDLI